MPTSVGAQLGAIRAKAKRRIRAPLALICYVYEATVKGWARGVGIKPSRGGGSGW